MLRYGVGERTLSQGRGGLRRPKKAIFVVQGATGFSICYLYARNDDPQRWFRTLWLPCNNSSKLPPPRCAHNQERAI
jgi:hypothetical protein